MADRIYQIGSPEPPTEHPIESARRCAAAERHYFLRLWIDKALYQRLVRAHGMVRQADGSRAELAELLDRAVQALLAESAVSRERRMVSGEARVENLMGAGDDAFEAVPPSEPSTVRSPETRRWSPEM